VVESWSICAEDEDWCRRKSDNYTQYKKEYENLMTTFNPVKFNPSQWAAAAKNAGMRYMVFTTKHHDGFCMFDTKSTDYKVTDKKCPYHKNPNANITKEIFDAFRKEGFMIGVYFSKPDWHNPDYWWPNFATPDRNVNYNIKTYPDRWENFVKFTHKQIDELMSDYGEIDILWLDGGWVQVYSPQELYEFKNTIGFKQVNLQSQDVRMSEIVEKARKKQPGLIVVDRAVEGKFQNYLTPENRIPDQPISDPWESNIISGGGYSYTFNATYKSGHEVVKILVDIVSKGGNLLLNIAPSPAGEFDEGAYKMLQEVGHWMKINSECIYNSRAVKPHKDSNKVYFTGSKSGHELYAIYIADSEEKAIPHEIFINSFRPDAGMKITMLGNSQECAWQRVGHGFKIIVPEKLSENTPNQIAWVFKIIDLDYKN
jgi:alpha-L-fucosidase